MKNKVYGVLLLSLILMILPACSMKDAVEKMSLELKRVQVKQLTQDGFKATVYMQVNNPNWFGMRIADLNYRALINGREVAKGRIKDEIKIPSDGSVVAELPVEVTFDGLDGDVLQAVRGKLDYRVTGEVVFKAWFGSYTLPFDTEKNKKDGEEKTRTGKPETL